MSCSDAGMVLLDAMVSCDLAGDARLWCVFGRASVQERERESDVLEGMWSRGRHEMGGRDAMKCGTGRRTRRRRVRSGCAGPSVGLVTKTAHSVQLEYHWKLAILNHAKLYAESRCRSRPASTLRVNRPIPIGEKVREQPLMPRITAALPQLSVRAIMCQYLLHRAEASTEILTSSITQLQDDQHIQNPRAPSLVSCAASRSPLDLSASRERASM